MEIANRVYAFADRNPLVKDSIQLIESTLLDLTFDSSKFIVSFNGGKDCTVLLHLVYAVLTKNNKLDHKLKTLYIHEKDTFKELEDFVKLCIQHYNLEMHTFEGSNYKKALEGFKSSKVGSQVNSIFMGMRTSDLSYPLKAIQQTDDSWPKFIRVNPILDWSYHDVWTYLRTLNVSYCPLYDQGYTSLGARSTTSLNPRLRSVTPEGEVTYLPAYFLDDAGTERSGRSK